MVPLQQNLWRPYCLCFWAELQALQLLCSNSPSGIPRALGSLHHSVNFQTRDVGLNYCFQTAFIPVPLCREGGGLGSISFCMFGEGGEWPKFGGLALCSAKITHLLGSIFVLARTRKKPKCAAFNYTNSLIGDIAMVIHMQSSLVLDGHTLGITPPLPVTPYHEYNIVLAVQMVNVQPQSSTNTNWRSTVWFFRPGSVKIQANFFGIGIV